MSFVVVPVFENGFPAKKCWLCMPVVFSSDDVGSGRVCLKCAHGSSLCTEGITFFCHSEVLHRFQLKYCLELAAVLWYLRCAHGSSLCTEGITFSFLL